MKGLKLSLVIMAAALLTIGLSGMAYAFHNGGVANCDGCHTMHGVVTGGTLGTLTPSTQNYLLQRADPGSTCLNCHAAGHGPTVLTYPYVGVIPAHYNPGGDFAWLQKTYGTGSTAENGETHGHNVIASDFLLVQDNAFSQAPGGTIGFLSSNLTCISCHDPHGKYRRVGDNHGYHIGTPAQLAAMGVASLPISGSGSTGTDPSSTTPASAVGTYRLLAGMNYSMNNGAIQIPYPGAPIAVEKGTIDAAESKTSQTRVAYGNYNASGITSWAQWCGTCHSGMIGGIGGHVHPVDVALHSGGEDAIYGTYISSGNMTGTVATSYLSLVPFIEDTPDYQTLSNDASSGTGVVTTGPDSRALVSCLSCHRAHASGFKNMMRWNMENQFLTSTGPVWQITASRATSEAESNAAYNGRTADVFGAFQRSLCNKCHAQD